MRFLKLSLSFLALLFLIGLVAIVALMYFIDPNQMKPVLIAEIQKETGYQARIDGALEWFFYPRIGIKAPHIALTAPTQNTQSLDAYSVRITTNLLDLLHTQKNALVHLSAEQLQFKHLHTQKASAYVQWKNNILTVSNIEAAMYGGVLKGVVTGSALATLPRWTWNIQAENMQIKALLQDANGTNTKVNIDGTGRLSMNAETEGRTRDQILNNLNGTGEFKLVNGWIEGIDVNYFVLMANAILNKEDTTNLQNTFHTNFNELTGMVEIKKGIVETRNLLINAPNFITKARGDVVLNSGLIDFKLNVKPQLDKIKGNWIVPIVLRGDLEHPVVQLDTIQIQKILAVMEIERIKEKAIKQIQKHIPGKTGEFLQQLLR